MLGLKHGLGVTIAFEALLLDYKGGDIGGKAGESRSIFEGALRLMFTLFIVCDIDFLKDGVTLLLLLLLCAVLIGLTLISSSTATSSLTTGAGCTATANCW